MKTKTLRIATLLFLFFSLAVLAIAANPTTSNKVTGTITLDNTKVVPQHVYAYTYVGLEPGKKNITLLFSDKPVEEKVFKENFIWAPGEPVVSGLIEGAWKSMQMEKLLQGISMTVNSEMKIMSNEILIGGRDDAFSIPSDDLVLEAKSEGNKISGKLRTSSPTIDAGGKKLGIDLSFDVTPVELK
jgi:hypothetical protein